MDTLRVYQEHYAALPGWFTEDSAAVWDCLLAFQRSRRVRGHAFEIGVFHGKSAALACLHLRPEERLVLVDPYRLDLVRDQLGPIRTDGIVCHSCLSSQLPADELLPLFGRCRWVHIDGEHTGTGGVGAGARFPIPSVRRRPRTTAGFDDHDAPAPFQAVRRPGRRRCVRAAVSGVSGNSVVSARSEPPWRSWRAGARAR